jgi:hypothetical protein
MMLSSTPKYKSGEQAKMGDEKAIARIEYSD